MHRFRTIAPFLILLGLACGGKGHIKNVSSFADISGFYTNNTAVQEGNESPESIIKNYSVTFEIPNPLFGKRQGTGRKVDPSHEDTIICKATLLDDISTEADMAINCRTDSLSADIDEDCRKSYREKHIRDGMFRIRMKMESGFSTKSLEPDQWAIYIENARGIMIEPDDIVTSPIIAQQDTIGLNRNRVYMPRRLVERDITLYMKKRTFFGEDLFGKENPHIVLVMSYEKKTVARVAWNLKKIKDDSK